MTWKPAEAFELWVCLVEPIDMNRPMNHVLAMDKLRHFLVIVLYCFAALFKVNYLFQCWSTRYM